MIREKFPVIGVGASAGDLAPFSNIIATLPDAFKSAIQQFEQELKTTRDDLQKCIKQLKSMDEKMQSSIEELQSAKIELETSHKEQQSLNEELITVNLQLRLKSAELDEMKDQFRIVTEEAEQSRQTLEVLMDYIPQGIIIADTDDVTIRMISKKGLELTGRQQEVITGISDEEHSKLFGIYHLDGKTLVAPSDHPLTRATKSGEVVRGGKFMLIRPDGSSIYISTYAGPIKDKQGNITGGIIGWQEITDQKHFEFELFKVNQQLYGIFDHAPAGLALFEAVFPYRVLLSNQVYNDLSPKSFKVHGMIGKTIPEYAPASEVDGILAIFDDVLESKKAKTIYNLEYHGMVRGTTWWNWHVAPVVENGKVAYLFHMAIDVTEQFIAQKQLQKSEDRFRIMADDTPLVIWVVNAEGQIEFINRAYRNFFGVTLDQVKGPNWQPLVHPDDSEQYIKALIQALETHTPFHAQARVKRADGQWRWVESHGQPRFSENGTFIGIAGSSPDITKRKETENKLRESQQKISEILESIEDGFLSLDRNWNLTYINRRAANNGNFKPEQLIGQNIWEKFPYLVGTDLDINYRKVMNERVAVHFELTGSYKPVTYDVSVYPSAEGITVYWRDITEKITYEKNLKAARDIAEIRAKEAEEGRRTLQALMEHVPEGITIADGPEMKIRMVSRYGQELLGFHVNETAAEVAHKWTVFQADGITILPDDELPLVRAITRNEIVRNFELVQVNDKGVRIPFLCNAAPIKNSSGEITGEVVVWRDITDRKVLIEKLRNESNLLQTIYNSIPVMLIIYDPDKKNVRLNQAFENITGWTLEKAMKSNVMELVYPDPIYRDEVSRYMDSLAPGFKEIKMTTKNGSQIDTNWANIEIADGRRIGIGIDITESKRVQRKIEQSARRFSLMSFTVSELLKNTAPQSIIENLCRAVMEELDCQVFVNYLIDEQCSQLHLNACSGITVDLAKEIEYLPLGHAVCGCVARDGKRIIAEFIQSSENPMTEVVRNLGVKAYACYPLTTKKGKTIGTLSFGTKMRDTFNDEDLSFMKTIADQVSVAIDRRQAEEDLAEKEKLFRAVANTLPYSFIVYDPQLQIQFANGYFHEWTNLSTDQITDRKITDLLPEEISRVFLPLLIRAKETGERQSKEASFSYNNMVYDVILHFVPLKNSNNQVTHIFNLSVEISELKQMERQIHEYANQLQSILESISDGVIVYEPDGSVVSVNPAAIRMSGIEMILPGFNTKTYKERYKFFDDSGNEIPFDNWPICRALKGEEFRNLELKTVKPPQSDFDRFIDYSSSFVRDESGNIKTIVITTHDITRQKGYEQALKHEKNLVEQRANELAAVNKELESFSYSVSHDLRNPLNTIKAFTEFLLEDYTDKLDDQGKDYLARIKSNIEKMNSIINDILALSKISRQEVQFTDIDLSDLVQTSITELSCIEPDRNIELIIQRKIKAKADISLMRIALGNLISNAWKYTGKVEHPRIEFNCFFKDNELIYFVKDNGAGFDMKRADILFTPFKRLHRESEFKGTGIGLAIVEKAIHRHGGRIWAEAEPGKGATFYFTLQNRCN